MAEPVCTQNAPYFVDVEPGTYRWCACGRSKGQPFCDGSHAGTGITPVKIEVDTKTTLRLCGCRRSKNPPLCDGEHNNF
jgi:CDGSH-type Zn-finger protein